MSLSVVISALINGFVAIAISVSAVMFNWNLIGKTFQSREEDFIADRIYDSICQLLSGIVCQLRSFELAWKKREGGCALPDWIEYRTG